MGLFLAMLLSTGAHAQASAPSIQMIPGASGPTSAQIVLAWNAAPTATSYNVYRGTSAGGEAGTAIATGLTSPTYTDQGLTAGTYYYFVTAVNDAGESAHSNEAHALIPNASAAFVKVDTTTQGNWKDSYGSDGHNVIGDTSGDNPHYRSTVSANPGTHTAGVWAATSLSPASLQMTAPGSAGRMAGVWFQTSWTLSVGTTQTSQLALYLLDLNSAGYAETITIRDAASGTVLDTRSAASFSGGSYYVWNVTGNITITFTATAGNRAVLSGIFFGPAPAAKSPSTPAGLGVAQATGGLKLTWTASTGAVSYNIYRGTTAGGESTTPIATGVTTNTYTNTGLTPNTTYYYKVVAVNGVGGSKPSTESFATAPPPTSSVTFVKTDTTTQGSWKGVYGIDG